MEDSRGGGIRNDANGHFVSRHQFFDFRARTGSKADPNLRVTLFESPY